MGTFYIVDQPQRQQEKYLINPRNDRTDNLTSVITESRGSQEANRRVKLAKSIVSHVKYRLSTKIKACCTFILPDFLPIKDFGGNTSEANVIVNPYRSNRSSHTEFTTDRHNNYGGSLTPFKTVRSWSWLAIAAANDLFVSSSRETSSHCGADVIFTAPHRHRIWTASLFKFYI